MSCMRAWVSSEIALRPQHVRSYQPIRVMFLLRGLFPREEQRGLPSIGLLSSSCCFILFMHGDGWKSLCAHVVCLPCHGHGHASPMLPFCKDMHCPYLIKIFIKHMTHGPICVSKILLLARVGSIGLR